MSWESLFSSGYGSKDECQIWVRAYLSHPSRLTKDRIPGNDQSAARCIAECQRVIRQLQEYREALAERYAQLDTMPYARRLELERSPSWGGRGVTYYVRIIQTYEDGTKVDELHETYSGKDRRTAINRFEELKKKYPGIEIKKDIEKRSWEK